MKLSGVVVATVVVVVVGVVFTVVVTNKNPSITFIATYGISNLDTLRKKT